MLMIQATAVVALLSMSWHFGSCRYWVAVSALMLAAASVFSGDIALHTLTGSHLFPMAAPTGGSVLIASWVIVAVLAGIAAMRSR